MDELPIYSLIHNQYQVLDHSGQLPFSIVFGLCRRASEDKDPRPLILNTRRSALDVPYALANKLLRLNVEDADLKQETALAINKLSQFGEKGTYLTLPSPVNRKENWKTAIVAYRYQVDPDSELASIFRSGRKYEIRFASEDLGVKWHAYEDQDQLLADQRLPTQRTEKHKLVSKPSHGRCAFTVVPSLPWPPILCTKLELGRIEDDQSDSSNPVLLQISTMNTGTEPVSVQTRGAQRFLVPWGPMQPDEPLYPGPRIIDSSTPNPIWSLRITDKAAGTIVRIPPGNEPCGFGARDPRPKLETIVTIKPDDSLVRLVDMSKRLTGLQDGTYEIDLEPRGMWWCEGSREEFAQEGDDRVPHRLWDPMIPPMMLESENTVEVHIKNGKVV
ncbi:hypothetical protein BDV97DRAFT_200395 [Delphinella strobiligena]|nr:hypothetical protein BDV97DRAFT_200395 [Delphinella strobiligena]